MAFNVNEEQVELFVFFHFINESGTGASYQIELLGGQGENFPDDPPVPQAGDLVPVRSYFFIV